MLAVREGHAEARNVRLGVLGIRSVQVCKFLVVEGALVGIKRGAWA